MKKENIHDGTKIYRPATDFVQRATENYRKKLTLKHNEQQ